MLNVVGKGNALMNENVTVALFGDCATHMAGEKYKHTRAVGLTNWLSIISPTTENFQRLTQEELDKTSLNGYEKRICFLNSNKKFLDYLLGEKADYLIIDCNDCRKQLIYDEHAPEGIHACITDNWYMPEFRKCVSTMFGTRGGISIFLVRMWIGESMRRLLRIYAIV